MAALMPVAEALRRVLDGATPLPAEAAPLHDAHGRVLAADLAARRTQPPADVSAMDGYAVRAADVATVPAQAQGDRRGRGRASVRRARSAPARRRGSSPAACCRRAPTPS